MARSGRNMAVLLAGGLAGAALALATRGRRYSVSGKVVLLTGGSRGLGLLMARQLAAEGARLALVARNAPALERAAGELRRRGAEVLTLPADVGDSLQMEDAVDAAARTGAPSSSVSESWAPGLGSPPIRHSTGRER